VAAACSLGFAAAQIVLIHSMGLIKELQPWSTFAWLILGLIGLAVTSIIKSPRWLIAGPCYLIGAAFLMHSFVYREGLGAAMGFAMFIPGLLTIYALRKFSSATVSFRHEGRVISARSAES
jgi:hypothetical protein